MKHKTGRISVIWERWDMLTIRRLRKCTSSFGKSLERAVSEGGKTSAKTHKQAAAQHTIRTTRLTLAKDRHLETWMSTESGS